MNKRHIKYSLVMVVNILLFIIPIGVNAATDPCSMMGEPLTEISCNSVFTPEALDLIREVLAYFRILGPAVLIVMIAVDFTRAVAGNNKDDLAKCFGRILKRCIATVLLFLVPTIVMLLLDLDGLDSLKNGKNDPLCYNSASGSAANNAIANTSKCAYTKAQSNGWVPPAKEDAVKPGEMASDSKKCDGTSFYGNERAAINVCKYSGGGGSKGVTMLKCAANEIEKAFTIMNKYCGTVYHDGAMRSFSAEVNEARSKTSFHYTGRAIDLSTGQGMQNKNTYFYVTLDNTTGRDDTHYYRLYCKADKSSDPSGYVKNTTITPVYGTGMKKRNPVTGNFLDVTAVLNAYGFDGIGPRSCYKTNSMCLEWWHFQNTTGLVKGKSTFGDALKQYYGKNYNFPSNMRACMNGKFSGMGFSC